MAFPSTSQALRMGARAASHNAWLVAVALPVAFVRAASTVPALLFALAVTRMGAEATVRTGGVGSGPRGVLAGSLAALSAPRSLAILGGLWLAGVLIAGALRVAYLAGALPVLGEDLARETGGPTTTTRFARGLARGFSPLLGTALLGLALVSAAELYAITAAAAGVLLALHPPGGLRALLPAVLGAGVLTSAIVALLLAGLAADGALARTALVGERPLAAFTEALGRVLRRPAAFLLAALAMIAVSAAVLGSAHTLETASLALARGSPVVTVLGPRLMLTVFAAAMAALLDLWRLGTVASLSCG